MHCTHMRQAVYPVAAGALPPARPASATYRNESYSCMLRRP
jgi:hypothetical protein